MSIYPKRIYETLWDTQDLNSFWIIFESSDSADPTQNLVAKWARVSSRAWTPAMAVPERREWRIPSNLGKELGDLSFAVGSWLSFLLVVVFVAVVFITYIYKFKYILHVQYIYISYSFQHRMTCWRIGCSDFAFMLLFCTIRILLVTRTQCQNSGLRCWRGR